MNDLKQKCTVSMSELNMYMWKENMKRITLRKVTLNQKNQVSWQVIIN